MTVGVYGLVAGIVKLDDLGLRPRPQSPSSPQTMRQRIGWGLVGVTPYLMRFLSIAGTTAMFLVGGGILSYGIPAIHHTVDSMIQSWQTSNRLVAYYRVSENWSSKADRHARWFSHTPDRHLSA
ncbi:MAG: DUF808 family protein [Pirellulaceae bacterium]